MKPEVFVSFVVAFWCDGRHVSGCRTWLSLFRRGWVSTVWRIPCSARVRIMRAVRSCKDSYTKKSSAVQGLTCPLLFGCDLHLSGLNVGLNLESSVLLPIVAAFCQCFPSRMVG